MDHIELIDGSACAEVVPARGAIVSRFDVGATPVLYLDRATLEDPTKNVRGGVPFLFPTAGRLEGDRFRGREMKQHGFARNLPFAVERRDSRSLVLSLGASDETRARFPFEFRVELTISLSGAELRIAQRYQNLGVQKREVPFAGFDFSRPEVDLHLHDHGASRSSLSRPGGPTLEIEASPEFGHWVIWALAGKDFICVEPWTAPGNALNSGERLLWIEPAQERTLSLTLRAS